MNLGAKGVERSTNRADIDRPAVDRIQLPGPQRAPFAAVIRRIAFALSLVVFVALVVRLGRGGYIDVTGDPIGFLDALYYASVTVTTTGYGDITAVSSGARLATIVLITPARILFLILVVGTTVEVLTEQSRTLISTRRWRQRVNNHYIICGFGATGQAAARDLISRGVDADQIVAVEIDPTAVEVAHGLNIAVVTGSASQQSVLAQAGIADAKAVIVTPGRDDTAVLVTLTARELNPSCHIVTAGNEQGNLHLLRQGGADAVIDSTAAVGRMIGLGTVAPSAVAVVDDLLDAGTGLELAETGPVESDGRRLAPDGVTVVVVIRDGERLRPEQIDLSNLETSDRLIVLRDR